MNRRLLDPFQSVQLPETIEDYLEHGNALCIAFNRRGTLLASGTKEGQVVIWDYDTRGVASVLVGHEGPVNSVSWSRNGRYLLSGSDDLRVILWNVLTGTQESHATLGSAVLRVSLSPRPPHLAVVSLADGPPVLLDLATKQQEPLPVAGDAAEAGFTRGGGGGAGAGGGTVALFSRQGDTIIGCQLRGALTVVDTASRRILDVVRLGNSSRVLDLALNRKGNLLLATCQDQKVRMYEVVPPGQAGGAMGEAPSEAALGEALANKSVKSGSLLHGDLGLLRPVREFFNAVDRTPWRSAAFSHDSEHVVGVSAAKAQQQFYIWNRPLGNMERFLEGPKESALELAWHPLGFGLLSCANSGRIYIWAKVQAENWSAFAPDFKELDENTEYVEREDEFDWNTPGARGELGLAAGGAATAAAADADAGAAPGSSGAGGGGVGGSEVEVLDILTREPYLAFSSDEEDAAAEELLYLPVVIEKELTPSAGGAKGAGAEQEAAPAGEGEGGPQGFAQQQQQQQPAQMQPLPPHRFAEFPKLSRRGAAAAAAANGGGGEGGRGGRGSKRWHAAAAATDSGEGAMASGVAGGEGTDMEEDGWGQGQGPGQQQPQGWRAGRMVAEEVAVAAQRGELAPGDLRQLQAQQQQQQLEPQVQEQHLLLQQQLLQKQQLFLQQQQLLQMLQQQQQQGAPGQGQPAEWMAAAAAAAALQGVGPGLVESGWAGLGAAANGDVEMRDAAGGGR